MYKKFMTKMQAFSNEAPKLLTKFYKGKLQELAPQQVKYKACKSE